MMMHMHVTGGLGGLSDDDYAEALAYVTGRVEKWRPMANGHHNVIFDGAVLGLCLATIDEARLRTDVAVPQ